MILKVFPQKDTFITNAQVRGIQQTGSNLGGAHVLDVFKVAGVSGAIGVLGTASLARTLVKFDLSQFSALTASGDAPTRGSSYFLRLRHATTTQTLPASFDVDVLALSRAWDEGRGLDVERFYDKGFACWTYADSSTQWSAPGGDFVTSASASVHFDTGYEDLEVNVTQMVGAWLTGGLANHGFLVKLTASLENDAATYYLKRFYGRSSDFGDRRPCLEMRWDDSVRDDRSAFKWNVTGTLGLYNRLDGQPTTLSVGAGFPLVKISDSSGTLLTVTASYSGRGGFYSASFALPTGSYSGSIFTDVWYSGSFSFMTGSFTVSSDGASVSPGPTRYAATVRGIQDFYEPIESPRIGVQFRPRSYAPSVVLSGSSLLPKIVKKAYYRVDNDATNEQVVPFGTGSVETTRLSYDAAENFFDLRMTSFQPGNVYRILFLVVEDGVSQLVDPRAKFKVM